jgi:3-deoxy-D-manno-octulosonic-acid transferase
MQVPGLLLLLVPRHPQRFDEVARLLDQAGLRYARRSAQGGLESLADRSIQVLLGDSMGEMAAYYAACDLAFVGGSLLPLGGQNLIEPCALARPVLVGPHTFNFREVAVQAIEAGAAIRVADPAALAHEAERLFGDPAARAAMGEAGAAFARHHRGATARTLDRLPG